MNNYPKVSILLAAYNSDAWIYESIQSILCQTYPNLELILCDDGTENFDPEKIEHFVHSRAPHVPFTLIHQQKNIGTVRNLNTGLRQADGEWIIPFAADDCFASPQAVEQITAQLQTSGLQWAVARTALCDENLNFFGKSFPPKNVAHSIQKEDVNALYFQLCTGCCLPGGGSVFSARLLREMGGFDENYRLTEDWPLFLKLVRRGLVPALSEQDIVLHRHGGVSRKQAGKNRTYQHDLITILREEVAPYLADLDNAQQNIVQKLIQEKELGYEFRFSNPSTGRKLFWAMTHPLFIARKIFHRREPS